MSKVQRNGSILPLTLEQVSYHANGKRLIDDVSLTIPQGGLTALIGPNGAGKTLLLNLCHGLLVPSSGHVRWACPTSSGDHRHAMVFQKPVMLRRSVRGNLTHALLASGLCRSAASTRADEALERFGLAHLSLMPARQLSGGEQQRLAIARAWALKPEIMFLDEPTSQLDPGAARQIEQMLTKLKEDGMTLVMVTHDLAQARRLAEHVLFIHQGRVHEQGEVTTFFAYPTTAEARSFLAGDLLW